MYEGLSPHAMLLSALIMSREYIFYNKRHKNIVYRALCQEIIAHMSVKIRMDIES
jgi:hypothetical protein